MRYSMWDEPPRDAKQPPPIHPEMVDGKIIFLEAIGSEYDAMARDNLRARKLATPPPEDGSSGKGEG